MKKTIENQLIALQSPEQIKNDFLKALQIALESKGLDLGVPKNFTGDGFASQELTVAGLTQAEFKLMANGKEAFPQGEHFQIAFLRIYEGANAVLNETDWVAGTNDPFLKNATIDIIINGVREWVDVPLISLTRSEEQNDSGYLVFLDPKFWFAQTDLQIVLKPKKAIATANLNVRMELSGCKLIS